MGAETKVVSRSTTIAAPPERVWALVSDLPRMGEYSPEAVGGTWVRGDGPAVGAVFRGRNVRGVRRWSTRCEVVRCVPGVEFAFRVSAGGRVAAQWAYDLQPEGSGCRLTETWTDERGALLVTLGKIVTGVSDRSGFTAQSIEQTLERVKQRAEQQERG
jgi:carbon monoxide dehydrogenase subunit G